MYICYGSASSLYVETFYLLFILDVKSSVLTINTVSDWLRSLVSKSTTKYLKKKI